MKIIKQKEMKMGKISSDYLRVLNNNRKFFVDIAKIKSPLWELYFTEHEDIIILIVEFKQINHKYHKTLKLKKVREFFKGFPFRPLKIEKIRQKDKFKIWFNITVFGHAYELRKQTEAYANLWITTKKQFYKIE